MKKQLIFILPAAALFLFSCASVQEKPDTDYTEAAREDGAPDGSASEGEALGEAKDEQAEGFFEAESEDANARGLALEGEAGGLGRNPIPYVYRIPRPLTPEEPRSLTREAGGGQAEALEADVPREEESPQESEREDEISRESQAAPPIERMPRPAPAQPEPTQPEPTQPEPTQAEPAQPEPLASGESEAEAAEAPPEPDEEPEPHLPSAESEERAAEAEEAVLGGGQAEALEAEVPREEESPQESEREDKTSRESQAAPPIERMPRPAPTQHEPAQAEPAQPKPLASGESEAEAAEAPPEPDEEPEPQEEEPTPIEPSRSVSLYAGQSLEVWYPGAGWVFSGFGESSMAGGMAFGSRRAEGRDTIFSFRALQPGSYILEFSRFDVLTGGYIEDALLAEVLSESSAPSGNEGRVVRAPDYGGVRIRAIPQVTLEEEEGKSGREGEFSDEPSVTVTPALPAIEERSPSGALQEEDVPSPEVSFIEEEAEEEADTFEESSPPFVAEGALSSALNEARTMIEEGDIESALSALDSFFAENVTDTDEALFLLGQAYEADSPYRDMRRALSAYETLTSNYPLSRFWQEADKRIRYIRRFYFDMR